MLTHLKAIHLADPFTSLCTVELDWGSLAVRRCTLDTKIVGRNESSSITRDRRPKVYEYTWVKNRVIGNLEHAPA